ncbi:penicillin-binding protein 1A [uncultured Desulfovibrio sp.]|uniref:penicillin-binding protein 1A n=1 Tax=uncultured Desulfovibrio sp. TaxID=167968 RepID=UPI0026037573|nr:PBP1A family penicillin-binding protein [uncultured Desulfovibrio sp.]
MMQNITWKKCLIWIGGLCIVSGIACSAIVAMLFFWASRDLPDLSRLEDYHPPQATTILARDGSILGTLYHEKRFIITLEDMPKYLPLAFLAAEDDNFYRHSGVDPVAIARAAFVNITSGSKRQGGSTITQQVIKQLLLTSERSYTRKMKEAILAYQLENTLSKDQILLTYLNYIYLGQHAYGVEAAARTYFGKHAADITLAEAAVIAGLPQAPSRYNPFRHPDEAKKRQMYVLSRMRALQWISEAQYQQASNEPLIYWSMPDYRPGAAQWYQEEARRLLVEFFTEKNLAALGVRTNKSGEDYVYEAGLTVRTSMDPVQQDAAGAALRRGLEELDKRQGWRGSIGKLTPEEQKAFLDESTFDPLSLVGDVWVKALVTRSEAKQLTVALGQGYTGVIPLANMSWARKPNPRVAGMHAPAIRDARAVAEAGDLIWVSAAPLLVQEGKKKQEVAYDPARVQKKTPIVLRLQQEPLAQGALASIEPQSGDVVALIGGYQFGNSHFNRATQARRQPGSSFKPVVYSAALDAGFTPTSQVLDGPLVYVNPYTNEVWRPSNYEHNYKGILPLHTALALSRNTTTVRVAQTIGIANVIQRAKMLGLEPDFPQELAVSLGAVAVSPLNLTQAYAAFANQGLGVRPRIITSIVDARGRELYRQDVEHWQAITPQNAYQMACLLREVVNAGTGSRARVPGHDNIGGKTGTTNEECDTWFVGFSPYLVTGVYVGFDQVRSLGRLEQGGRTAAPIFRYYRTAVEDLYKEYPQDFVMPPGITMEGNLAFNGPAQPGLSAVDGATPTDPATATGAIGADTSEGGEDLMRQMF